MSPEYVPVYVSFETSPLSFSFAIPKELKTDIITDAGP